MRRPNLFKSKKHKGLLSLYCAAILLCALLGGCTYTQSDPSGPPNSGDYLLPGSSGAQSTAKIALIYTEEQRQSFLGQQAYGAINLFSGEEGVSWSSYIIEEEDFESAFSTVELAIKGGAELLIFIGDEMEPYWQKAQRLEKDIPVITIDSVKHSKKGAAINFNGAEAGYLAGYAAVIDGARQIYVLESEVNTHSGRAAVNGAILGADAAAARIKLADEEKINVDILSFNEQLNDKELAALFKAQENVKGSLFFTQSKEGLDYALGLAPNSGTKCFGLDSGADSLQSPYVLTAIKKNPRKVLYSLLTQWKESGFENGFEEVYAGVKDEAIMLEIENGRFIVFNAKANEELEEQFANGVLSSRIAMYDTYAAEELPVGFVNINSLELGTQEEETDEE